MVINIYSTREIFIVINNKHLLSVKFLENIKLRSDAKAGPSIVFVINELVIKKLGKLRSIIIVKTRLFVAFVRNRS